MTNNVLHLLAELWISKT